ncbi:MAG: ABC transporter permease [Lutisporaceae bacterium]
MNKGVKRIIKKIISSVIIFITFIYITILISSSNMLFSIYVINNRIKLSGPTKETLSNINQKFISLLKFNLGIAYDNRQLSEIIMPYVIKSIELMIIGVLLGLIIGVLKGIIDSRRNNKDTSFKLLLSIIPLSLPDILIIAILQYFAIWLSKHGIKVLKVAGSGSVYHLILPVVALALPCACYIARITAMSIEECYKNEYVKIALGKGCSPRRILWNHVMRNVIGVIFKSLSNITAMIICNLIIVEYLFSYSGLTKLLIEMNKNRDMNSIMSIIVVIGIVYFVLDILFNSLRLFINGRQKEAVI